MFFFRQGLAMVAQSCFSLQVAVMMNVYHHILNFLIFFSTKKPTVIIVLLVHSQMYLHLAHNGSSGYLHKVNESIPFPWPQPFSSCLTDQHHIP
jgi:hypothetical protein